jgi:hypothetical protein
LWTTQEQSQATMPQNNNPAKIMHLNDFTPTLPLPNVQKGVENNNTHNPNLSIRI